MESDFLIRPEYFDFSECSPACSRSDMDPEFLDLLESAYQLYAFRIFRAYYPRAWASAHRAYASGAFQSGRGVVVSCRDDRERWMILSAFFRVGFRDISVSSTQIVVEYFPDRNYRRFIVE